MLVAHVDTHTLDCDAIPMTAGIVLFRASGVAAKLLKSAIPEVRYGGLCTDTSAAAVKLRQRLGVSLGKLGSTSW